MTPVEDLTNAATQLTAVADAGDSVDVTIPLNAIGEAADKDGRSFSGSLLGYHSRIYYEAFQRPPPGARFDQEWGLGDHVLPGIGTRGRWEEFDPEDVKSKIYSLSNSPDLGSALLAAANARRVFDTARDQAVSVLEIELSRASDPFLTRV